MSKRDTPAKGSDASHSGVDPAPISVAKQVSAPGRREAKWATMSRAMRERAAALAEPRTKGSGRAGRGSRHDRAVCSFRLAPDEAELVEKALHLLSLEARSRGKPAWSKSDALRGAVLAFMSDIVANGAGERHFEVIERAL